MVMRVVALAPLLRYVPELFATCGCDIFAQIHGVQNFCFLRLYSLPILQTILRSLRLLTMLPGSKIECKFEAKN